MRKLKVGEARILVAERGYNEPFIKGVKCGEPYITARLDKETYIDLKIMDTKTPATKYLLFKDFIEQSSNRVDELEKEIRQAQKDYNKKMRGILASI